MTRRRLGGITQAAIIVYHFKTRHDLGAGVQNTVYAFSSTPSCSDTPESTRITQTPQSHSNQHSRNSECPLVDPGVSPHAVVPCLIQGMPVSCM